jgi:hypothetical protein
MQRLEIFRQQITEEKERLGIKTSRSDRQPATYVTVHRAKLLDDGYMQLSLLHMKALKGTIRVKFINEQVHVHVYHTYIYTYVHVLALSTAWSIYTNPDWGEPKRAPH